MVRTEQMEDPDYILDIGGLGGDDGCEEESSQGEGPSSGRKCIYVFFKCCGVYSHVYKNRQGTAYEGRCPKCLAPAKALIGEEGTDRRFFTAE